MSLNVKKIRATTGSVLRYPGGKGKHASLISSILDVNGYSPEHFVEPFCGGASLAINLMEANIVDNISLNDIDPLVASLWMVIFSEDDHEWLIDKVRKVPLTLEYWDYQKKLRPRCKRSMALKCLYLNRTSFSGLLHKNAGPIGGRKQEKWTIASRFNREKIALRIKELSRYSSRVICVENVNWFDFVAKYNDSDVLIYFDPPYYEKANRLYRYFFTENEHISLNDMLKQDNSYHWILSYDNREYIRRLYSDMKISKCILDSNYSTHPVGGNSVVGRELLYTSLEHLPVIQNSNSHCNLSIRPIELSLSESLELVN